MLHECIQTSPVSGGGVVAAAQWTARGGGGGRAGAAAPPFLRRGIESGSVVRRDPSTLAL